MRRDSVLIFGFSVLITVGIVGGAYYFSTVKQPAPDSGQSFYARQSPALRISSVGNTGVSQETSSNRTDTPIKCVDPEIGEFWTNAATCEGADLYNRISIADPLVTPPTQQRYTNENYQSPQNQAVTRNTNSQKGPKKASYKPNLRLTGKSPPKGLPVGCKFPVGRALEIERALSAADNPRESTWTEEYCEWRREVYSKECQVPVEVFYFSYRELCQING